MRMRTKLSIVAVVAAGALLLILLAVIIAPGPQTAYAQSPTVSIAFSSTLASGEGRMEQGGQLFVKLRFNDIGTLPCDADLSYIDFGEYGPCFYRIEVYLSGGDTNNEVDRVRSCENSGNDRSFSRGDSNSKEIGFSHNRVPPNCPVGTYTLKAILMGSTGDDENVNKTPEYYSTKDFKVIAAPLTATPTNTRQPTATRQQGGGTQGGGTQGGGTQGGNNQGGGTQGSGTQPTATPTATPTIDPNAPTATPTATPTRDPLLPPPVNNNDQATATPTATPTEEGNGGNNGGQGNQQNDQGNGGNGGQGNGGNNQQNNQQNNQGNGGNGGQNNQQNNNQGRSNNQGGNNQGGNNQGSNNQGGVTVKSFISYPTPLPQTSQPQSQTPLAITIPEIMNVRSGPGLTYDIVTTVPAGTQGTIVGTDPNDDWYQVEIAGVTGRVWIYQDLTTLVGSLTGVKQYTALEITQLTTGTPSGDGTAPLAITIPELMNVRTGPGLTYNIVTTVPAGTQGYIYGIDPDNDWFHIELEGFDTRVWVYRDLTTVVGSLASVKLYTLQEIAQLLGTPGADGSVPLAITVPITMNVRTGPGLLYDIVGIVPEGTQGRIFGIDPDNDWFQIELEGLDTLVWVYQDLTTVIGSLAGVKWVTLEELALLPAAITQPALLNARAGPGLTFDILTTIPQGTWTKITGIDPQGEWYRVELYDLDQPAWIFRDYTKVAGGSLSGLIQLAFGGSSSPIVGLQTGSITVELSLPQAGGVDLDVSWTDVSACAQLYNLYHRASTDTTTYISLDQAATASTVNSKSLSFSTLSGDSFISAWCGQMAGGREVAEVEIDPGVEGTYSSTTTSGGLAAVPPGTDDN